MHIIMKLDFWFSAYSAFQSYYDCRFICVRIVNKETVFSLHQMGSMNHKLTAPKSARVQPRTPLASQPRI